MKNLKRTNEKENQQVILLKRTSFLMLALLLFQIGSISASNSSLLPINENMVLSEEIANSTFLEIINKMKVGHFFNATVTTLNEKKKGSNVDVFSSYGFTQAVDKINNTSIELKEVNTSFSDRSHFSGSKTIERVKLSDNGSSVNVEVTYVTWGNSRVTLRDVKIKKINQVYFLTGYTSDGSNATYYTIALKDMGRII